MEIVLALHNIRSTYNVGAILRTAEGFGVKQVVFSGYTPRVNDARVLPHLREKLNKEIHKTALSAETMLDIYSCDDIFSKLKDYQQDGYKIVGLENNITDGRLISLNDKRLKTSLGDRIVLLLGEEVGGIDYSLYDIIDTFVEIPMKGRKESFNVSVATGVALFGLLYI